DVTSRDSFAEFVAAVIERHGRIDVLVNNAGLMPLGDFLSEDDAISRTTFEVNVWGVEPEAVARAIVGSVASRRAEITVPRYLAGWDLLSAAAPNGLMSLARKVIRDRRALTSVEHDVRDAYEQTVEAQARERR
ncbi:MAG: SDR family NAD(P)-dependent oxidoreductase, partial [Mycobacterium sp.]